MAILSRRTTVRALAVGFLFVSVSLLAAYAGQVAVGASDAEVPATRTNRCDVYPIAVPQSLLDATTPGQAIIDLPRGSGAGNFSWLTWAGGNDAPTLAASLMPPGNVATYRNPDQSADGLLEPGDWIQGAPGSMNASSVRAAMDSLLGREIVVPTWSESRGQGARFDYQAQRFAVVQPVRYQLTGQGSIGFRFIGYRNCYNEPPVVVDQSLQAIEDTPLDLVVQASDPDGDPLDFTLEQAPQHGTLTGDGPAYTYVPAANFHGTDSFSYRAADDEYSSVLTTVTIVVQPVNDAPVANDVVVETDEDVAVDITFSGSDVEGSAVGFRIIEPPRHGELVRVGGAWQYRPERNYFGEDSFHFVASDGDADSELATATIDVTERNAAPVATPLALETDAGDAIAVSLAGSDPDGDLLQFRVVGDVTGGTLSGVAPALSFQSADGFIGTAHFDYVANDGRLDSDAARVTIEVSSPNHAPVITSLAPWSGIEGLQYRYGIKASDPDPGDVLSYRLAQGPGAVSVGEDSGELSWTVSGSGNVREPNLACRTPAPRSTFDPVFKWGVRGPGEDAEIGTVLGPALVGQLTDDNGDGKMSPEDGADVVILTGHGSSGDGRLIALRGDNGEKIFSRDIPWLAAKGTGALADLDGDGLMEIAVIEGRDGSHMAVYEHDGTRKWRIPVPYRQVISDSPRDAIAIVDFEGDGEVELVTGSTIVEASGRVRCTGTGDKGGVRDYGYVPIPVDVDLDGDSELLAGRSIYDGQCQLLRTLAAPADGYTAVGNFDTDDFPEFVLVSNGWFDDRGVLFLFDHDGQRLFGPVTHPGGGAGGPPTLGNVDADPYPEIGVGGMTRYAVFDHTGSVLWSRATQDTSSHQTGSSFFDFEGDGQAEIIYGDEVRLWIYDGRSGATRHSFPNVSGTTLEYPVVADLDDDGSADLLVGFNNHSVDGGGLRVISSESGSWPDARALWNQHAFSIDNINADGSVPREAPHPWLRHNTFRLNTMESGQVHGLPDLSVFDLRYEAAGGHRIHATVVNRGLLATEDPTSLALLSGRPGQEQVLGSVPIGVLAAGARQVVSIDLAMEPLAQGALQAIVDPSEVVPECDEVNNRASAAWFEVAVADRRGLQDRQPFSVTVDDANAAPVIAAVPVLQARIGKFFARVVVASDPDRGDGLLFSLANAPAGMTIEPVSGELRWMPVASQAGSHAVAVSVTDLRGAVSSQTVQFVVAANQRPIISSTAPKSLMALTEMRYAVAAQDPDGHVLTYTLSQAPAGMAISSYSGEVVWRPTLAQIGMTSSAIVVATDPYGLSASQSLPIKVLPPTNYPPVFDSSPVRSIVIGQRYQYSAHATDQDDEVLRYSLQAGPDGMAIDVVTGTVVWQPRPDQVGMHAVAIRAEDGRGSSAEQRYDLFASEGLDDGNHPPRITSAPTVSASPGQAWSYPLAASDPDGDRLVFSLAQGPAGMSVDSETGLVGWTPTSQQLGLHVVILRVEDGRGGSARQSFSVMSSTAPGSGGNQPPRISSDPLSQVAQGQSYRYYLVASDPDGDALAYSLLEGPAGMTVSAQGAVAWTPSAVNLGEHVVFVSVSDGRGGTTGQGYRLRVVQEGSPPNHRPMLLDPPFTQAKVGARYCDTLAVVDADGTPLQFSLTDGPAGVEVDAATGRVCWTPDVAGSTDLIVRASDGASWLDVGWTLGVAPADEPLSVQVVLAPERVALGGAVEATVVVTGAASRVTVSAMLSGEPVVLDADGQTRLAAPSTPGLHRFDVSVTDGHDSTEASADLFVADPNDSTPPTVALQSPDIDAEVTAPTAVTGQVMGADVARWTLGLVDPATGVATVLVTGQAETEGVLGQLDPTLLVNGHYTLVLQAWDGSGNRASDSRSVRVTGDMKLGHYSVSFEDVEVPLAGFPLRVTRTYDTRRRNESLDFGYGWSVDYQNLRITESRRAGFSWTVQQERDGYFANWCVRPNGDPIVAITLPDGEVMSFRAKAMPECQFLVPSTDVKLVYEPIDGTDAQLQQTDYEHLRLVNTGNVSNLVDLANPYDPADPQNYRLTLPDGTIYSVSQGFGIRRIDEPDGNHLLFSHAGVKHSRGPELRFLRNAMGRIEEIVLPDNQRLRYTYTADGDLEMAVDAGGGIASFTYLPRAPHYLQDIIDPRGIRVSRNEYDDNGRLRATIDADGHRIEFDHDLAGRQQVVRNRRGKTTVYHFDESGRVLAETNALGETVRRTYDSDGNEKTTTNGLGHTTTRTFDPRGNLLTETNAEGETVIRTYDARNQVLTETDNLGRVVATNVYNGRTGRLSSTKNALGETTKFGYDSGLFSGNTGALTGMTDATGAHTRFIPDEHGRTWAEIDALGHVTEYHLDAMGRTTQERRQRTRADGSTQILVTTYKLDAKGRAYETVHSDQSVTTVEYDGNDKPTKTCDGLRRCTVQHYNDRGELWKTEHPDGTFEEIHYDENGNVDWQRDRGGRVTRMRYDDADRLVETLQPDETPGDDSDNPRVSSEYDAAGRLTASIDANGNRTEYRYDDAGRRTQVIDAQQHVTETRYDDAGQREAVIDALGRVTDFGYDNAGRLVETTYDDGSRSLVGYDAAGRKASQTDEMGRLTRYGYDGLGRLTLVVLPNPLTGANPPLVNGEPPAGTGTLVTRYGYDEVGNKLTQTDAEGRVTRWSFDSMGRELSRTLPLGQTETFGYDAAGQRIRHVDFNGRQTLYGYDAAGRPELVDFETDADVHTTYTASGQRETVTDGQGTTTYRYDAQDRLTSVSYPDGQAIAYGYDANGNRTRLQSAALDQTFVFDTLNRLDQVESRVLGGPVRVIDYDYDAVGNRQSLTQANGVHTTYGYDVRHRLRSLVTRTAASVLLFAATYTVDDSGLRTAIAEANAAGPTRNVGYAYDAGKRLVGEAIQRPGQAQWTATFEYDAVGNRLRQDRGGITTTYRYDGNDRLLEETSAGASTLYAYDDNGNTLSQISAAERRTFTWSQANRRIEANVDGTVIRTGYHADGLRNRETVNGRTTTWLLDPNRDYAQVIESYTGADLATVMVFGDELHTQHSVHGGSLAESALHMDGMGSVRMASDASAALTDAFEYDAWGNELARAGETGIEHRYRGEQVEAGTGLYNLRARWMDPTVGRFVQHDSWNGSLLAPLTLNKFVYADSDPVNGWDPSGFYTQKFGYAVEQEIERQYISTHSECGAAIGFPCYFGVRQYHNPLRYLKPDVMNWSSRTFLEIKPFSLSGIYKGGSQLAAYKAAFGTHTFGFSPDSVWTPREAIVQGEMTFFMNAGGIIFYTDDEHIARRWAGVTAATASALFRSHAVRTSTKLGLEAVTRAVVNQSLRMLATINSGRLTFQASTVVITRI